MFSQTAEYALRIAVFLGALRGQPATTRQIAAATRVPQGYLSKILQSLNRAGLVHSQRGPHGGSILARQPELISILDVVTAIAPLPRIRTCPLGLSSHGSNLCALHKRLDDAVSTVEAAFRAASIAELLAKATASIPLVDLPSNPAAAARAAERAFPVPARASRARSPRGKKPR